MIISDNLEMKFQNRKKLKSMKKTNAVNIAFLDFVKKSKTNQVTSNTHNIVTYLEFLGG
ncbi:hypothetical protein J2T13_001796 [Paenibacillus sp. DS2015]